VERGRGGGGRERDGEGGGGGERERESFKVLDLLRFSDRQQAYGSQASDYGVSSGNKLWRSNLLRNLGKEG
jgi:hypothetical protein